MNFWAIDKELRIKHFLIELVHLYGENTFWLFEHRGQYQAVEIYLADPPETSAYVYTFSQLDEKNAVDLKFLYPENEILSGKMKILPWSNYSRFYALIFRFNDRTGQEKDFLLQISINKAECFFGKENTLLQFNHF